MSVLIKDMEIPKTCAECPCCSVFPNDGYEDIEYFCNALDHAPVIYGINSGRLDDCPLTEVPTPQNGLIDVDEIEECVREWMTSANMFLQSLFDVLAQLSKRR